MRCLEECKQGGLACEAKECRNWIKFEEEYNCLLESVNINGSMTLREVADRMGVSFVRVQQIEKKALKKMRINVRKQSIYNE